MTCDRERLDRAYHIARASLLGERNRDGYWTGELSTSALSTATAVCALSLVDSSRGLAMQDGEPSGAQLGSVVRRGIEWLAEHQNADGGWGDTTKSTSNISTTMLARAAFAIAGRAGDYQSCIDAADDYINRAGGTAAVKARYGKDRTFAVPILMTCALAEQVEWGEVGALPFELAALPHKTFKWLNLPVVSYALPALIAVGQMKFFRDPPRNVAVRLIRRAAVGRSLRVLERIQPTSGGFLEAVPLTSFVTMALAAMGWAEHPVARRAVDFLVGSVRPDGSWPIDSNLSVWLTTLSVNALCADEARANLEEPEPLRRWLLEQQFRDIHPYTSAAPGAWGWTHLPGSVPDADDTAGALLALAKLGAKDESRDAALAGIGWLLDLQNRDGGWPTFCRGWGHLPFDRSGADLTAHALRALAAWKDEVGSARLVVRIRRAIQRGLDYLERQQRGDGSWMPLWFGNQYHPEEGNPTYGTARVLLAYRDLGLMTTEQGRKGVAWLVASQGADGGWGAGEGTPASVEETAVAVEALCGAALPSGEAERLEAATQWLVDRVEDGTFTAPSPIGFYFAKLWYFERLYPRIFVVAALERRLRYGGAMPSGAPAARARDAGLLKSELRSG